MRLCFSVSVSLYVFYLFRSRKEFNFLFVAISRFVVSLWQNVCYHLLFPVCILHCIYTEMYAREENTGTIGKLLKRRIKWHFRIYWSLLLSCHVAIFGFGAFFNATFNYRFFAKAASLVSAHLRYIYSFVSCNFDMFARLDIWVIALHLRLIFRLADSSYFQYIIITSRHRHHH